MKHYNVRGRLIDRTISVIASEGLDKTTTKAIVKDTDIPEAYIYQYFSSKDELFAEAFEKLDEELFSRAELNIPIMYTAELDCEMQCRTYFSAMWRFMLDNRERCITFIRYYYSPYFEKYSSLQHKERYLPLVEEFSKAFVDEANVWMLLNHILNVMLDFAVKVFYGAVGDNEDTAEHVFRLVYYSIRPYFMQREVGERVNAQMA